MTQFLTDTTRQERRSQQTKWYVTTPATTTPTATALPHQAHQDELTRWIFGIPAPASTSGPFDTRARAPSPAHLVGRRKPAHKPRLDLHCLIDSSPVETVVSRLPQESPDCHRRWTVLQAIGA